MKAESSVAPSETTHSDFQLHEKVGHLLRRAYQRHAAIFQQAMSNYQLTAAQFIVLTTVREQGSCSQSEIVRVTAVDQATVRGIIDRLKARGLVSVTHDPDDGRKVTVKLTPEGLAIVAETIPVVEQISEATYNGLNSAEQVALLYLLRRVADIDDSALAPSR